MKKIASTLSFLLILLFQSCDSNRYIVLSGYAQGGNYAVKMNMDGVTEKPEVIQNKVDSLLNVIDNSLSGYNKGSLLSKLNAGEEITPNEMLKDIYEKSYKIWEETEGAVDVASGPLFDAWGFGFTTDSLPKEEEIKALMDSCGMDMLYPDLESSLKMKPQLNFNAIAQGYSCDIIAEYLKSIGTKDMLVDIGEIYCEGLNPNGKPWSLGVDCPKDGNNTPGANIQGIWRSDGRGRGVVTSGNYRKYYIKEGRKYAHTIDPRNGYPVNHNLLSATIIAPNATLADAYATYCMVIGLENAKEFILDSPELEAYLIYDENGTMKTWNSPGFNLSN